MADNHSKVIKRYVEWFPEQKGDISEFDLKSWLIDELTRLMNRVEKLENELENKEEELELVYSVICDGCSERVEEEGL